MFSMSIASKENIPRTSFQLTILGISKPMAAISYGWCESYVVLFRGPESQFISKVGDNSFNLYLQMIEEIATITASANAEVQVRDLVKREDIDDITRHRCHIEEKILMLRRPATMPHGCVCL